MCQYYAKIIPKYTFMLQLVTLCYRAAFWGKTLSQIYHVDN